ncbi:MAG: ribonuclease III [Betaproteobacteria bacterium RBG_16_66_20]|nr:MAG: ribonuclease III [Betaproteobacteria bacterium RBG_16_66_20]
MARHPVLERRIGHRFQDSALLSQALTHRSFGSPHNERLEFLGDGVIGCVIAEELYARFPDLAEGELSRLRASLVREAALATVARALGLAGFLRLGEGEVASGGGDRPSILADALEAVYGAVFLDGGYEAVRGSVRRTFGEALEALDPRQPAKDDKTRLQELLQARRQKLPEYRVVATAGAAHKQVFEVECVAAGLGLRATGSGSSRRRAEQQAAGQLLKLLES